MQISRALAIKILKYLAEHPDFYFPFQVVNTGQTGGDEFIELEPAQWRNVEADESLQTFELWENLQHIFSDTIELMAAGFVARITGESARSQIAELAIAYRKEWKVGLWESTDIQEYGLNEFIGGKAEAYEDCLRIISEHIIIAAENRS